MDDPDERGPTDDAAIASRAPAVGFGVAAGLLAVAAAGAATAGVLDSVGPYLLGVSALLVALAVLVVLARR